MLNTDTQDVYIVVLSYPPIRYRMLINSNHELALHIVRTTAQPLLHILTLLASVQYCINSVVVDIIRMTMMMMRTLSALARSE